ncbi:MAG: hypothetical protein M1834_006280 [Cirrosporium novae-zelandiae]|nr:MAG: hypothetical protein M1834_006280 [Cirrosporium novae-zelandiae]
MPHPALVSQHSRPPTSDGNGSFYQCYDTSKIDEEFFNLLQALAPPDEKLDELELAEADGNMFDEDLYYARHKILNYIRSHDFIKKLVYPHLTTERRRFEGDLRTFAATIIGLNKNGLKRLMKCVRKYCNVVSRDARRRLLYKRPGVKDLGYETDSSSFGLEITDLTIKSKDLDKRRNDAYKQAEFAVDISINKIPFKSFYELRCEELDPFQKVSTVHQTPTLKTVNRDSAGRKRKCSPEDSIKEGCSIKKRASQVKSVPKYQSLVSPATSPTTTPAPQKTDALKEAKSTDIRSNPKDFKTSSPTLSCNLPNSPLNDNFTCGLPKEFQPNRKKQHRPEARASDRSKTPYENPDHGIADKISSQGTPARLDRDISTEIGEIVGGTHMKEKLKNKKRRRETNERQGQDTPSHVPVKERNDGTLADVVDPLEPMFGVNLAQTSTKKSITKKKQILPSSLTTESRDSVSTEKPHKKHKKKRKHDDKQNNDSESIFDSSEIRDQMADNTLQPEVPNAKSRKKRKTKKKALGNKNTAVKEGFNIPMIH